MAEEEIQQETKETAENAPEATETVEAPKEEKKKKISRMTLDEVKRKLKNAEEKMGGSASQYVQQLRNRKVELES